MVHLVRLTNMPGKKKPWKKALLELGFPISAPLRGFSLWPGRGGFAALLPDLLLQLQPPKRIAVS